MFSNSAANRNLKSTRVRLGNSTGLQKASFLMLAAILVLLASVSALSLLNSGKQYWVVTTDVPAGANLSDFQLRPLKANLGETGNNYASGEKAPEGFLNTTLSAGELLETASISIEPPATLARVVIQPSLQLSGSVRAGSRVAIWSAAKLDQKLEPVKQLVSDAEITNVKELAAAFGQTGQQVELQLQQAQLPALLDALASNSALYLVAQ